MADCAMFSNMCLSSLTCPLDLYKMLSWTLFWSNSPNEYDHVLWYLVRLKGGIDALCWQLSLNLNFCLCLDLILMIKRPFVSKQTRLIKYFVYSTLVAVLITGL